jgi:hypothetical protein
MRHRKPLTPVEAIVAGSLAGAVGTVCMDTVRFLRQRREGGVQNPLEWEFAAVPTWKEAPDPGQVGRRLIEGFTQRKLPDSAAWLVSTLMHWSYGSAWGAVYGVLSGSMRRPHAIYGAPFGAVVWASGYVVMPLAGLYEPIWKYDRKTLGEDLTAHLAYGTGTGLAFWLLSRFLRQESATSS